MQQQQVFKNEYMLTNSEIYLCSEFKDTIKPVSSIFKLSTVPHNMQRTSPITFVLCQTIPDEKKTKIVERNLNGEIRVIEEFEGIYSSCDFCDDYALLLNRDGDFLFYNMLSKNIFYAEKQHPGVYVDANIMHTNEHFITCGGCVKNQTTAAPERIIKVWGIDNSDCLVQKFRINTGHHKPIEHSFVINKSTVVSMSTDKTIRFTNLIKQEISSIIKVDYQFLSGCQLDYNTIVAGGMSKFLKIYDQRTKKMSNISVKLSCELIQVVNLKRFTDNHVLVSNINQIYGLDLRMWRLQHLADYDGQRISEILTLNNKEFVVGNREKTLQFWEAQ